MKVSIVIPTFNHSAWLPHAVKSCQDQTHKDIEIIIVDDCSDDTTGEYIEWLLKQGDKRIVYHRNERNMGRSYSRNKGNDIATGEVICVLDSDDLMMTDRVALTVKKMANGHPVCYGSAVIMDAIGIKLDEALAGPIDSKNCLRPIDLKTKDLIRENGIVHSSMAYTKEISSKYPYSDGKIAELGLDDWEMQVRMIRDGVKFGYVPEIITAYRLHGQGISQTRNPEEVAYVKSQVLNGVAC